MKKHFSFRQMPNVFTTVSRHCNGGRTGVGIDVNSPSPHSSKRGLGKSSILILLLLTLGVGQIWAGAGTFDTGACALKIYASGYNTDDVWMETKNSTGASNDNIGTISSLYLKGTWWKMWKDNDGNICTDEAKIYYKVFFTSDGISGDWGSESTTTTVWDNNNVTVKDENLNTNLLSGCNKNGNYTLVYNYKCKGETSSNSGCDDDIILNNGNQNYAIIFTYYPNTAVTFGAGTGMSQQGTISCHKNGETSTKYTSGQEIAKGTSIIFSATPKAGYELAGWYSDAACTNSLQNGANDYVMTTAGESQSVYAKFVAQHVVTLVGFDKSFAYAGNVAGSANMVIPVGRTYTNYSAVGGVNNVIVNGNTFTFNATGAGTVTAIFGYKKPDIEVNPTANYQIGGAAIKLNPKYTDVAADATYSWSCTGVTPEDGATINDCQFSATNVPNPNISATKEGTYTITVTVTQGGDKSATQPIQLTVTEVDNKCATCFQHTAE